MSWNLVNIGSDNGSLPNAMTPLPEQMLTYHQCGPMAYICGQFHWKCLRYQTLNTLENYTFQITARGQYIKSTEITQSSLVRFPAYWIGTNELNQLYK